jgi:hypothetical protein
MRICIISAKINRPRSSPLPSSRLPLITIFDPTFIHPVKYLAQLFYLCSDDLIDLPEISCCSGVPSGGRSVHGLHYRSHEEKQQQRRFSEDPRIGARLSGKIRVLGFITFTGHMKRNSSSVDFPKIPESELDFPGRSGYWASTST